LRVVYLAAHEFRAVLDQGGGGRILKNNVIARIAFLEFFGDFFVEIVVFVFGFPIAERHAQGMEQRAIGIDQYFAGVTI
jgi:hypothetical protein